MATIRNISMPSRRVSTSIWPMSAILGSRNEADAAHAGARGIGHHLGDFLVAGGAVGAQVDFRLRLLARRGREALAQRFPVDAFAVPVELARAVDGDADVLGLGQVGLARSLG